jgi:hypothetical protein
MQRLGIASSLLTVVLLLTLMFPAASPKAAASPAAAPGPPHPHIVAALDHMRQARGHMAQAEGEFEGHRARSIELLDQAIHEAELCTNAPK